MIRSCKLVFCDKFAQNNSLEGVYSIIKQDKGANRSSCPKD